MRRFGAGNPDSPVVLHFLRRRLSVRRRGLMGNELAPIFPGYVFLETDGPLPYPVYRALRRTEGFFRILKADGGLRPLEGRDLEIVMHFLRLGSVAEKSKVVFDEADRISVLEGPLKGLEGNIVKVDKRKGRAKIKLDLYEDSFTIDLAFEKMTKA